MMAFPDIKAVMRENAIRLTDPSAPAGRSPLTVGPSHRADPRSRLEEPEAAGEESHPFIQPWMEEAFHELLAASHTGAPFALMPCTVNGEPSAAIVMLTGTDEAGKAHVTPLFVAGTPGMVLRDTNGRRAGGMG